MRKAARKRQRPLTTLLPHGQARLALIHLSFYTPTHTKPNAQRPRGRARLGAAAPQGPGQGALGPDALLRHHAARVLGPTLLLRPGPGGKNTLHTTRSAVSLSPLPSLPLTPQPQTTPRGKPTNPHCYRWTSSSPAPSECSSRASCRSWGPWPPSSPRHRPSPWPCCPSPGCVPCARQRLSLSPTPAFPPCLPLTSPPSPLTIRSMSLYRELILHTPPPPPYPSQHNDRCT